VNKRLKFVVPASASANIRLAKMTLPSGNWRYRVSVVHSTTGFTTTAVGIALRESATGKLILFSVGNSGGDLLFLQKWTDPTTFSATYTTAAPLTNLTVGPHWLEVEYDGTNYYWRYSYTDVLYAQLHSAAKADFFTTGADELGPFGYDTSNNGVTGIFRELYRVA
jgi:hypothetical protein